MTDGNENCLSAVTDSIEVTLGADGDSYSDTVSSTVAGPSGQVV